MSTENKPLIYKKMADISDEIKAIEKTQKNTQQNFMFRGVDDVYNAVHPLLKKHRVFMISKILERSREERTTAKGGNLIWTLLLIEWSFYAEDGSFISSTSQGEAMDSGDKGSNKAMSVSQKYAIIQTFSIPLKDGNPDPDKNREGSEEEFLTLSDEIEKFTDSASLADWANGLKSILKYPELVEKVKNKIKKLNNK